MKNKNMITVILLAAVTLLSCKKEGQCYNCTYGIYNGWQKPADEYCGDISKYRPKAADGGDISFYCQPK